MTVADDLGLRPWQLALIVGLGAGDLATGLLLVASPGTVERLLALLPVAESAIWLRWIGIFVAVVGTACLWPLRGAGEERRIRLRFALEWTVGARLAVAVFVAVAVLSAELPHEWCRVGAYDAVAAIALLALLGAWKQSDAR